MRLTLAAGTREVDLDVPDDVRLGDLRPHLAAAAGRPGLADGSAVLAVDDAILDDDHLTGQVPLLPGAVLRVGAGSVDVARAALRARWHLAVISGPDSGALLGLPSERECAVVVGRSGRLAIDDVGISRQHLEITGTRAGPQVRDLGSSNGTTLLRARRRGTGTRRARPLGRRGRRPGRLVRLRAGDRLAMGATVLEIRGSDRAERAQARDPARRPPGPGPSLATWLGPAIGSLVLAMSTGNRLLLGLALLGPGVAAWPVLRDRAARRRARRDPRGATARRPGRPETPSPADEHLVPSPADLTARALRSLAGVPDSPAQDGGMRALAPDGCLAVVGPRPLAVAAARALVATLIAAGRPDGAPVVRAAPDRMPHWAWCRWLTQDDGAGPPLLVADGSRGADRIDLARRWAGGHGAAIVLVEQDRAQVPPWCRTVLEVRPGCATMTLELPDGTRRIIPLRGVSLSWAEAHARRVAAIAHLQARGATTPAGNAVPVRVALGDLPNIPSAHASGVAASWSRPGHRDGLAACLGLGAGGVPVVVDLVRDGPHALVAGTTGAGKSELLQSLLLSLALTHSPADLAIALVDYKGGASFGACAGLPHVVGQVTDLDPAMAARALSGLRAELRSRERALAAAGVSDLATLRAGHSSATGFAPEPPPRLLIVVDEFRALTEDLPNFVPGLLRLAAQGRSLGIHLVLATQRPAGAVGPDLRANLALRIALRVTDAADSLDVLDVPDAAQIPAALPGRAILRKGAGPAEPLQIAHADGAPRGRAAVRVAAPWSPEPPAAPEPPPGGWAQALVDAARAAAALTGVPLPEPPWLPPLPDHVLVADLRASRAGLPLGLADIPAEQRRAVLTWDPHDGHLLVLGAPGSGRSTTLRTVGIAALEQGWHVHAVGMPGSLLTDLIDHPGVGTMVDPDDPRRLARLVTLLGSDARGVPQLLLVDGLEAVLDALGRVARGAGAEHLIDLLRSGRRLGVAVVATAGAVPGPVATHFTERLVLAVGDRMAETVAGVPADLTGARRGPGRAIRLPAPGRAREDHPADAVLCQVAVAGHAPDPAAPCATRAHRISPLPDQVGRTALARPDGPDSDPVVGPVVGLGGDDARAVRLDVSRGALVVGPPGSGRSTALAVIGAALLDAGRPIAVIARDGPLRCLGTARAPASTCGFAPGNVGRVMDDLPETAVVLVDDLDALEQQAPGTADRLGALVGDAGGPVVVAAAQTARAAVAYRGALGALRTVRRGLILGPAEPGSSEVLGVGLDWTIDLARPHAPGRGVRQHGRDVTIVQVFDPEVG